MQAPRENTLHLRLPCSILPRKFPATNERQGITVRSARPGSGINLRNQPYWGEPKSSLLFDKKQRKRRNCPGAHPGCIAFRITLNNRVISKKRCSQWTKRFLFQPEGYIIRIRQYKAHLKTSIQHPSGLIFLRPTRLSVIRPWRGHSRQALGPRCSQGSDTAALPLVCPPFAPHRIRPDGGTNGKA